MKAVPIESIKKSEKCIKVLVLYDHCKTIITLTLTIQFGGFFKFQLFYDTLLFVFEILEFLVNKREEIQSIPEYGLGTMNANTWKLPKLRIVSKTARN